MSLSSLFRAARRLLRRPSPPRLFPTTGFDVIDNSYLVDEEGLEWYSPEEFYPVRIGEVFKSEYQVVGKLGYGAYATVWLAQDLVERWHVALKIGTCDALSRELSVLKHLKTIRTNHAGSLLVRNMLEGFEIINSKQKYQAIIHLPLAISIGGFRKMFRAKSLPVDLVKAVLQHVFIALEFLHTEAKVIHTDLQEKNILLGLDEKSAENDCENFVTQELKFPSPRKIDGDRVIYTSRTLVPRIYNYGRPVLCDFGEARRVGEYNPLEVIQPVPYRAPEVRLGIPWDEKVDIWNVGVLIWDMLGNGNLFKITGGPENKEDIIYHLAHMIALLGPPPKDLLERCQIDQTWQWFDRDGNWKGAAEIPHTSLEDAEKVLKGDDKAQFLRFVRKMLKWKPEERQSARELLKDPWLNAL